MMGEFHSQMDGLLSQDSTYQGDRTVTSFYNPPNTLYSQVNQLALSVIILNHYYAIMFYSNFIIMQQPYWRYILHWTSTSNKHVGASCWCWYINRKKNIFIIERRLQTSWTTNVSTLSVLWEKNTKGLDEHLQLILYNYCMWRIIHVKNYTIEMFWRKQGFLHVSCLTYLFYFFLFIFFIDTYVFAVFIFLLWVQKDMFKPYYFYQHLKFLN